MSEKMEKVMTLINKANKDYATVEILMEKDSDYYFDIICFHCQQCIEKYLKAFLLYNETNFPKTHNLTALLKLCLIIDSKYKDFDLSAFSSFGVEVRYDDISINIDEIKEAFETTKTVMDYVKSCVELEH